MDRLGVHYHIPARIVDGWIYTEVYFGCFLDEGWCLKDTTTFSASFYTSNRLMD